MPSEFEANRSFVTSSIRVTVNSGVCHAAFLETFGLLSSVPHGFFCSDPGIIRPLHSESEVANRDLIRTQRIL